VRQGGPEPSVSKGRDWRGSELQRRANRRLLAARPARWLAPRARATGGPAGLPRSRRCRTPGWAGDAELGASARRSAPRPHTPPAPVGPAADRAPVTIITPSSRITPPRWNRARSPVDCRVPGWVSEMLGPVARPAPGPEASAKAASRRGRLLSIRTDRPPRLPDDVGDRVSDQGGPSLPPGANVAKHRGLESLEGGVASDTSGSTPSRGSPPAVRAALPCRPAGRTPEPRRDLLVPWIGQTQLNARLVHPNVTPLEPFSRIRPSWRARARLIAALAQLPARRRDPSPYRKEDELAKRRPTPAA
jgi:hypothetical protein